MQSIFNFCTILKSEFYFKAHLTSATDQAISGNSDIQITNDFGACGISSPNSPNLFLSTQCQECVFNSTAIYTSIPAKHNRKLY